MSKMLDEVRKDTPEDAEVIDRLAEAKVFFYDGPGVILPSGRRVTGEGMRALVAEAGLALQWADHHRVAPYTRHLTLLSRTGWGVTITDADTGKPILTCLSAVIKADVKSPITADLTMFVDADGQPLLAGEPVPDGDEFRVGTFTFLVAEMRVKADEHL